MIALTAYAQDEARKRALAAGFEAHVGKPFDIPAFIRTCADVITKTRAR